MAKWKGRKNYKNRYISHRITSHKYFIIFLESEVVHELLSSFNEEKTIDSFIIHSLFSPILIKDFL